MIAGNVKSETASISKYNYSSRKGGETEGERKRKLKASEERRMNDSTKIIDAKDRRRAAARAAEGAKNEDGNASIDSGSNHQRRKQKRSKHRCQERD